MSAFAQSDLDLEPQRVREMLEGGEAEVVDVREAYEREAGHIPGTRHIELERLASQAGSIDRERDVLELLVEGATTGQIAERLRISQVTVRRHVSEVVRKLDADNRAEAVRMVEDARREG